jgi:putative endonuclease
MSYFVYVLANSDGKTYIGQTDNLARRLAQHSDPECRTTFYTKRNPGLWRVVYKEEHVTRQEAMKRERQLKSGSGRRFIKSLLEKARG